MKYVLGREREICFLLAYIFESGEHCENVFFLAKAKADWD
jgi:hypothetical protein